MSYEPTVWKTGDVVTSGKLNKLENAVANCDVLFLEPVFDGKLKLNKTIAEIHTAIQEHKFPILVMDNGGSFRDHENSNISYLQFSGISYQNINSTGWKYYVCFMAIDDTMQNIIINKYVCEEYNDAPELQL